MTYEREGGEHIKYQSLAFYKFNSNNYIDFILYDFHRFFVGDLIILHLTKVLKCHLNIVQSNT